MKTETALKGLFLLAFFYTLHLARVFLVPMVLALLLTLLLSPLVRRLGSLGVPRGVAAGLVLVALVSTISYAGYKLWQPATQWIASASGSVGSLETKIKKLLKPVAKVSQTADQVAEIAEVDASGTQPVSVEIKGRSMAAIVAGGTGPILASALFVGFLCYFLLASGDLFLGKAIKALPTLSDKKLAVQLARNTEEQISRYLLTTTIINIVFGTIVGVVLYFLGMPNPVLWGALAGITNYVPYVGSLVFTAILAFGALLHFDDLGHVLLMLGVFTALNLLEGNVFTPMVLGRQLSLNAPVVFVSVLFWGWIWGIAGALLAVPIMAALKIACDHIEPLAPLGEFLGE